MRRTPATQPGTIRRITSVTATFAVVAMACTAPAWAQLPDPSVTTSTATTPTSGGATKVARLIEWDLPAEMDSQPGAMMVDLFGGQGTVWFVTRAPGAPGEPTEMPSEPAARVYRLDVKPGAKRNYASWFSYQLDPALTGVAGGVRKIKASKDKRYVFVRTIGSLQRIDTQGCVPTTTGVACPRAAWMDGPTSGLSDIVVDDVRNVFTALSFGTAEESYIQRIDTNKTTANNATRWKVGGSAGSCTTFEAGVGGGAVPSSPCLSGIDVHPRNRYLIYYSEPTGGGTVSGAPEGAGAIAELNTSNHSVRRWSLADLSAKAGENIFQPRQLHIDHNGKVWVVAGSGHLVSLDPGKNRMSEHTMPGGMLANDPWGIAPDNGMIGYTVNGADLTTGGEKHAVAMLAPDRDTFYVAPSYQGVPPTTVPVDAQPGWADRKQGQVDPKEKTVPARVNPTFDGTFIEALVGGSTSNNDSLLPLGITPDQGSNVGTFFYAVGETNNPAINRVGRVRLPRENTKADHERDDDDCDDDGKRGNADDDDDDDGKKNHDDDDDDNDGKPDNSDDDDDNDGVDDKWDSRDHKEGKSTYDDEADTPSQGHSDKTFSTTSNTLLVVAVAQGSDLLSPVTVEIIDDLGQVVAVSPTLLGSAVVTFVPSRAGIYTSRAKNIGPTPSKFSTTIITREPWIF